MWTLIRLSDLGPHCLQNGILKSQADDKADNNCCDWRLKGSNYHIYKGYVIEPNIIMNM